MSLTHTRSRTLAAVAFLAATGLFLTACGPDGTGAASDATTPSGAASATDASAENRETARSPAR
ncbi:hypothetical protein ACFWFF_21445 [Streptomyces sp. NPDC060223]|uniref:hypothetical protein n=1 Tax=unclassified Streptomyces TaxID=2593676 RepID=UPI0036345C42